MSMRKPTLVTKEGLERLKAEMDDLVNVKMPAITAAVAEARSHGDLRENGAYDAARIDQMMAKRRIDEIDMLLRNVEIISDNPSNSGVVSLGSRVIVDFDGDEETYTLVGAVEASPKAGLISNESPIGRALLGKRPGQTADVVTPGGVTTVKILRIE